MTLHPMTPDEALGELLDLIKGQDRHLAKLDPSNEYDVGCGCSMVNPEHYASVIRAALSTVA